jgi:hypothetical protein
MGKETYWSNYRKLAAELFIRYYCNHTERQEIRITIFVRGGEGRGGTNSDVTTACAMYIEREGLMSRI